MKSTKSDVLNYRFQQKRGKKAQNLSDYNDHVLEKIRQLNILIKDPETSAVDRKKYRN